MKNNLKKIVIITGGNKGIGLALKNSFSLVHYNVASLSKSSFCDITNDKMVKDAIEDTCNKLGHIDILINCAGYRNYSEIQNVTIQEYDKIIDTNLKGTFLTCKYVIPIMRQQKSGYIINFSSIRGITGAKDKGIYSAAKFAIRGLTESIQLENKEYGIKATSICPGIVWTASTKEQLIDEGLTEEDVLEEKDIVNTVHYLLSLSSKAYIHEIIIGGNRYS